MTVTQRDTINIRRTVLRGPPGSTPGQWLICMASPYRSSAPRRLGEAELRLLGVPADEAARLTALPSSGHRGLVTAPGLKLPAPHGRG